MVSRAKLAIPFAAFLGVYVIVPVFAALILADIFVLDGRLREVLPQQPETIFLYALLFNVPHHIASLFSFADRDYMRFYRGKLLIGLPVLLGAFLALFLYAPALALIAFILYTEYHVMSQQSGIARFYVRRAFRSYEVWKWMGVGLLVLAYGKMLGAGTFASVTAVLHAWHVPEVLMAAFLLLGALMLWRTGNARGKLFLAAIMLSIVLGYGFIYGGYIIFALAAGRIIHDITAFMVYISHDYNRNRAERPNLLYRSFRRVPVPVYALTPLLAVGIAYLAMIVPYETSAFLLFVFMTHYYVEGFAWKNGTPHRDQVAFG